MMADLGFSDGEENLSIPDTDEYDDDEFDPMMEDYESMDEAEAVPAYSPSPKRGAENPKRRLGGDDSFSPPKNTSFVVPQRAVPLSHGETRWHARRAGMFETH